MHSIDGLYDRMQSPKNPQTISFAFEVDGMIQLKEIIQSANHNFLKYDRMRSRVTADDKFEVIRNFDCKENIFEWFQNESFPTKSRKLSNQILCEITRKSAQTQFLYTSNKPLWRLNVYQFTNNKSVIELVMHHCIGDGAVYFSLIKQLCNIPSNLTNNTKLIGFKRNSSFIKFMYFGIIFLYRFLIVHVFKYFWRRLIHRKAARPFESKITGRICTKSIEIDSSNIVKVRKQFIGHKHTFNDFLLTVIAEGLVEFMKNKMKLKDDQLPYEISIIEPVNLRPFYDNFKYETVMGNADVFIILCCRWIQSYHLRKD